MMNIVDRRGLDSRHKSSGQKERFRRRHSKQIEEAVARKLGSVDIDVSDLSGADQKVEISIPKKDLEQPIFRHGKGGRTETVHPGNTQHIKGDRFKRPEGSQGAGSGSQGADGDEGSDDFSFTADLSQKLEELFEGRKLPNRQDTDEPDAIKTKMQRHGFSNQGSAEKLDRVKTAIKAVGRHLALKHPKRSEIDKAQEELIDAEVKGDPTVIAKARENLEHLMKRRKGFLDPLDSKFRNYLRKPIPSDKVVVFLMMDVSGSMVEARKKAAKIFFVLYVRFLKYLNPDKELDIHFIRHHTAAKVVNETQFFNEKETGATLVSPAYDEMDKILIEKYPNQKLNFYAAHATDGENMPGDDPKAVAKLVGLLPKLRHFAYLDIREETFKTSSQLWASFLPLSKQFSQFAMQRVMATEVGAVAAFKKTFPRAGEEAANDPAFKRKKAAAFAPAP